MILDKRKNNGGNKNAGRKPKAEELKVSAYARGAIVENYGTEKDYWNLIAQKAMESNFHMKTLNDYAYGKPIEKRDVELAVNSFTLKDMDKLSHEERLEALKDLEL